MRDRTEEALSALLRDVRAEVANQVRDLVLETPAVGSRDLIALRLRSFRTAEMEDVSMVRPAAMDCAVGFAVYAVTLDLAAARYKVRPLGTDVHSGRNGNAPLGG